MFRPLPALAAMTLSALALTATARSQPLPKSASKGSALSQPTDLSVTGLAVGEATDRVTVQVRFDSRIGLRGVKVRLTVAGGGQVRFERTQLVDMPLNSTQAVTFKVPLAGIKAQIPPEPFQAVRFLTVTATVDPDNAVSEDNEGNNTKLRLITF